MESASKSRTPTPGIRPVSSVVLDANGCPVDRLLIKNVENFYFLLDGFPSLLYFPLLHFPSVRSTPAFSTPAFSALL